MSGYPYRGNNILGLVRSGNSAGQPSDKYSLAADGKPYTTLGYMNGPGAVRDAERPSLLLADVLAPTYRQQSLIPLSSETHGGEDVAIYATGVNAHFIRGSMEENWIFYVMADALGLARK